MKRNKITKRALEILSDFKDELKQPASLSGKYHRGETMDEHLKRCANIMQHLCDAFNIHGEDRDMLIAASLLHDIGKFVLAIRKNINRKFWNNHPTGWSRVDLLMQLHPVIGDLILDNYKIARKNEIKRLIAVHMAHWYKNDYVKRPKCLYEYLIVLADYLASRKQSIFEYDTKD